CVHPAAVGPRLVKSPLSALTSRRCGVGRCCRGGVSSGWWAWLMSGGVVPSVQARRPVSVRLVVVAVGDAFVVGAAGEEQFVGVGGAVGCPVRAVVDLSGSRAGGSSGGCSRRRGQDCVGIA